MPSSLPFSVRFCLNLISLVLITLILYQAKHILIPLVFGGLFALMLLNPCNFLERYGFPRGFAALISVILFICAGIFVLLVISSQLMHFKDDLPGLMDQLVTGLRELQRRIEEISHINPSRANALLDSISSKTFSGATSIIGTTVSTVSNAIVYLVLIPIYIFLLLYYRELIVLFLIKSFREDQRGGLFEVLRKTKTIIKGYILGLFAEMLIVAVLNCSGFLLLGVKYALLLGTIAAVLNVIPYLGIFMACILSMIVTYTTNTPATVLGVLIVLVIVHIIDANFILLKVVGSSVKINALATLMGVIIGGSLWGIPGMFLAIPLMAISKLIFEASESSPPWGLLLGEDKSALAHSGRSREARKKLFVWTRKNRKD